MNDDITMRRSTDDDSAAILKLAALDSRTAPDGDALLAFVGGELQAALPLDDEPPIANPFRPTRDLVALLSVLRAA